MPRLGELNSNDEMNTWESAAPAAASPLSIVLADNVTYYTVNDIDLDITINISGTPNKGRLLVLDLGNDATLARTILPSVRASPVM